MSKVCCTPAVASTRVPVLSGRIAIQIAIVILLDAAHRRRRVQLYGGTQVFSDRDPPRGLAGDAGTRADGRGDLRGLLCFAGAVAVPPAASFAAPRNCTRSSSTSSHGRSASTEKMPARTHGACTPRIAATLPRSFRRRLDGGRQHVRGRPHSRFQLEWVWSVPLCGARALRFWFTPRVPDRRSAGEFHARPRRDHLFRFLRFSATINRSRTGSGLDGSMAGAAGCFLESVDLGVDGRPRDARWRPENDGVEDAHRWSRSREASG